MNMKQAISKAVGAALVSSMLVIPSVVFSQAPPPPPPPPNGNGPGMTQPYGGERGEGRHERHPHIKQAIKHLERVKDQLQRDPHDFGEHRVNAIHHIDEAIRELREALEYDKH